jgi:hypothetical protein
MFETLRVSSTEKHNLFGVLVMRHGLTIIAILALLSAFAPASYADATGVMMQQCRLRAHDAFKIRLPDIDTKYEGQRTDGTHAVNGTAYLKDGARTFQCSFDRAGKTITKFVVNERDASSADAKVEGTNFNATGMIPCARQAVQPMVQCKFGVTREDPANGNGTITVFWPDGGTRVLFYEDNTPMSYAQSEADGGAEMTVGQDGDTYTIKIGTQRIEIPAAVMTGG